MTSHFPPPPTTEDALVHLDDSLCWDILARNTVGRVGIIHRHRPVIFPVNYAVDGADIVFRTGSGTKLTAASMHRAAVFEVDEHDEGFRRGVSVLVHGWLHEVTDPVERTRALALPLRPFAGGDRDRIIRLHSGQVTGRGIGITLAGDVEDARDDRAADGDEAR